MPFSVVDSTQVCTIVGANSVGGVPFTGDIFYVEVRADQDGSRWSWLGSMLPTL